MHPLYLYEFKRLFLKKELLILEIYHTKIIKH